MLEAFKNQRFSIALIMVICFALFLPLPSFKGDLLFNTTLTSAGVILIFFLLGVSIPYAQLKNAYKRFPVHAFVGFWNFVGFPVISVLLLFLLSDFLLKEFTVGFLILAMIPTTIASAVTFTDLAKGEVSVAVFSSVLSNFLAIIAVPILAVLLFSITLDASIDWVALLLKISGLVLLPLAFGQIIQRVFPEFLAISGSKRKAISSGVILMIVYLAFSKSMQTCNWSEVSLVDVFIMCLGLCLLLLLVSVLVWFSAKLMRFSNPEKTAAFYCASQKSLATGLPLAVIILGNDGFGNEALVLLPLIIFHPMQLLFGGVLVGSLKRLNQSV